MREYDHKKIEKKWQKYWETKKLNRAKENPRKKKFYGLIEFPYPSGDGLHVGHIRSNTAMDIITRKRRAEGYEVLYPIGWDAFGLPTENYAIKTGLQPAAVTKKNTTKFRSQLKALGFGFDWSREVNTSDPAYYKWTQWIFLKFFEKGLAYKKKMAINWCPKDKIGLANEEVVDGCCERCGTPVEKREKEQWMLAITKYADRLDRDLDPPPVKKILVGTRNPAKVQMIKAALAGVSGITLISLDEIAPVDDSTLVEGDDFKKNARLKSEFYFKKTGIPTIATDNIFWIEKWPENKGVMVHMRKHANPKSPRATDEEILVFLKNFLKTVGGTSRANFHYAVAYTDEHGTVGVEALPHDYILQEEQAKNYEPGYPTEALMKDAKTKVFKADQPDAVRYEKLARALAEKIVPRMLKGAGGKGIVTVDYLERIKTQQKNWIGRSEGAQLRFKIQDSRVKKEVGQVEVFTTRPDTLFGATYLVLSPEHELIKNLKSQITNSEEMLRYIVTTKEKTEIERTAADKEKTGVELQGVKAVNPANGEEIPVWIADYVLADYGTGAIMAVPAHDERDFAFAKRYNLTIKPVIMPENQTILRWPNTEWVPLSKKGSKDYEFQILTILKTLEQAPTLGDGILVNSGDFDGLKSGEAKKKITEFVGGKMVTTYKLRDWVFSRQRYWGEPIPLIFCESCRKSAGTIDDKQLTFNKMGRGQGSNVTGQMLNPGWFAVPEKDLPVKLPKVKNYKPTDTGESPLAAISKWVNVKCPKCGGKARRETDTMPNWAGSSWYYLAYAMHKNLKSRILNLKSSGNLFKYWLPVDWYNGGMEHTTLHLLYSRFWHKFLFDLGLVPTNEPYRKRTSHGLVLGEGGVKMSKSIGNVINPDSLIQTFGADTLRLYEMFMGPFDQHIAWSTESMVGPRRFLEKVWRLFEKTQSSITNNQIPNKSQIPNSKLETLLHQTIKKVGEDIEAMRFNTAVSALMVLTNEYEKASKISRTEYEILLRLLAPFAPHITEELWSFLGHRKSIHLEPWPQFDSALAGKGKGVLVVQVNGKVRATTETAERLSEEAAKARALALPEVQKWIGDKHIAKVIYVQGRLVNIVAI